MQISYALFFPYHNFIISSIHFSGGVPIHCDTSQQFGSNYTLVFQTRKVFTSLEILLLNQHAYSVDQYENVKTMKNTFHQIDLLLFKILFDIRLKKTSPFFIHCSFKCSTLSWSIFEYLVSFLTDKIKFQIFFLDGINLFLWVSLTLNSPNTFSSTKYPTLHGISFGVLHPSRICSLM